MQVILKQIEIKQTHTHTLAPMHIHTKPHQMQVIQAEENGYAVILFPPHRCYDIDFNQIIKFEMHVYVSIYVCINTWMFIYTDIIWIYGSHTLSTPIYLSTYTHLCFTGFPDESEGGTGKQIM